MKGEILEDMVEKETRKTTDSMEDLASEKEGNSQKESICISSGSIVQGGSGKAEEVVEKVKKSSTGKSTRMTKAELEEWANSLAGWRLIDLHEDSRKEQEKEEKEASDEDVEEEKPEKKEELMSHEKTAIADLSETNHLTVHISKRDVHKKELTKERFNLEQEYFVLEEKLHIARERHTRVQSQVVQLLSKTEKDYSGEFSHNDSYQQKNLYVKLLEKYIKLWTRWHEMEDMEKEEVEKWKLLKSQVDEEMDALMDKRKAALMGKNRNERSPKFQLAGRLEEAERKKWSEANMLQTNNFLYKMRLEGLKKQLKERENIGSSSTITGYNQLKHENISSKEQILQKNEQIEMVLKNTKVTSEKMSHIKEKLSFVNKQHQSKMDALFEKERRCDQFYRDLNKAKHDKIKARQLLASLQSKSDLLSYPELLMDYEFGLEKTHNMNKHLTTLKAEYDDKFQYLAILQKTLNST